MLEKAKTVTHRISRRHSLDFIKNHRKQQQQQKQKQGYKHTAQDDTSMCSSSASSLDPMPLPLLESERRNQKQFDGDHTPEPVQSILSVREADQFLKQIQITISDYQHRISVLNQSIRQQTAIAKGRYVNGNGTGACLAMKKAKKSEWERTLTIQAMDLVLEAAVEVQMAIHRASIRSRNDDASLSSLSFQVNIGVKSSQVLLHAYKTLLAKNTEMGMGRQQLLDDIQELF